MLTRVYSRYTKGVIKSGTIISADLAKKEYPCGKISSHSGRFICKKCLEYVGFHINIKGTPYFRHSKNSNSHCDDKISNNISDNSISHYDKYINSIIKLPLRLDINSIKNFERFKFLEFKIGFPFLEFMKLLDFLISIELISSWEDKTYITNENKYKIYTNENIYKYGINYLSVGNNIVRGYKITVDNDEIKKYIPDIIEGIMGDTFFDVSNGNKISYGGNIIVNKNYFLLTKEKDIKNISGIEIKRILEYQGYFLYEFKILKFENESFNFIFERKYFLTKEKSKFIPVWSSYYRENYFMYLSYSSEKVFFTYNADDEDNYFRVFYQNRVPEEFDINDSFSNFSSLDYIENYQFLSFGRDIESSFLTIEKRDFLKLTKDFLDIKVFDYLKDEKEVIQGVYNQLPFNRRLVLKNPKFDGFVEILSNHGLIKFSEEFKAEEFKIIDNLQFGDTVNIYYGFDLVWSAKYEKKKDKISDNTLFLELQKLIGKKISISHSIGIMAMKMKLYPKTKNWFLKQIRKGFIVDKAFDKLRKIF